MFIGKNKKILSFETYCRVLLPYNSDQTHCERFHTDGHSRTIHLPETHSPSPHRTLSKSQWNYDRYHPNPSGMKYIFHSAHVSTSFLSWLFSYLSKSLLVVSGGDPPLCPFPSIVAWPLLTLSVLLVRSQGCCMARQTPYSTTCSLNTPNFPQTPRSKITTTFPRRQILMSQPLSDFLSPYCEMTGRPAGRLLLIDSSNGSEAPFSLSSPALSLSLSFSL